MLLIACRPFRQLLILADVINTSEFPVNLAALKLQVVEISQAESRHVTCDLLAQVMPALLKVFQNNIYYWNHLFECCRPKISIQYSSNNTNYLVHVSGTHGLQSSFFRGFPSYPEDLRRCPSSLFLTGDTCERAFLYRCISIEIQRCIAIWYFWFIISPFLACFQTTNTSFKFLFDCIICILVILGYRSYLKKL